MMLFFQIVCPNEQKSIFQHVQDEGLVFLGSNIELGQNTVWQVSSSVKAHRNSLCSFLPDYIMGLKE